MVQEQQHRLLLVRVRGYAVPRSFAGKLFSGIGNRIKAFFSALFSSLPIVNVFIGLGMIFGGRGNNFRYEKSKTRLHRLVFLALLVVMGLTVYVFEDGRWRGKIPEWSVTLTSGDQVPLLRASDNLYLHAAKAFNLTDDREEQEIKRRLVMSDGELIRITPLQNKKIWLLDPT